MLDVYILIILFVALFLTCSIGFNIVYSIFFGAINANKKNIGYWSFYGFFIACVFFIIIVIALANYNPLDQSADNSGNIPIDIECEGEYPFKCGGSCFSCDTKGYKLCCVSENDNWCCPPEDLCDYTIRGCIPKAYCGDDICQNTESCSSCASDCGKCTEDILDDIKNVVVFVKYTANTKQQDGSFYKYEASGSGVIVLIENGIMNVYTNRHVIDCSFSGEELCFQRLNENIQVRTNDGIMHDVSKVLVADHNLDIAILEVKIPTSSKYQDASSNNYVKKGDKVTAVGYPTYGVSRVLEFSVSSGDVTDIKELIMDDGFGFQSIESDAYTNFGSSGGGLFDESGYLVGINTWVDFGTPYQRSIAIKIEALSNLKQFNYCSSGSYIEDKYCVDYCSSDQVLGLGNDKNCYDVCKDFYCGETSQHRYDERCKDYGYVLGTDGYCHEPCGSGYCGEGNAICYKSRCITCPLGTFLFEDGTCRIYEDRAE